MQRKDTNFLQAGNNSLLFFHQIPLFFIYFLPSEAILAAHYGFNQLVVVVRGALPSVYVGTHTRENESQGRTYLPRPSYLIPGNRPLFPFRLRLCLLPSSYGCLHRPSLQSGRVGRLKSRISSFYFKCISL